MPVPNRPIGCACATYVEAPNSAALEGSLKHALRSFLPYEAFQSTGRLAKQRTLVSFICDMQY